MKTTKPNLNMLAKLAALASDDADASPDLRAYVSANADMLAPLFGTSTAALCAACDEVSDEKLGASMVASIKLAKDRERETTRGVKDKDATIAADRVAETARFTDRPGVIELSAPELRRALACREDRLRLAFADGSHTDVNATALRGILAERDDVRVYVDTSAPRVDVYLAAVAKNGTVKSALDAIRTKREQASAVASSIPVSVTWGAHGGMRLRGLLPLTATETHGARSKRVTFRAVNIPGLAFGSVASDQAAE